MLNFHHQRKWKSIEEKKIFHHQIIRKIKSDSIQLEKRRLQIFYTDSAFIENKNIKKIFNWLFAINKLKRRELSKKMKTKINIFYILIFNKKKTQIQINVPFYLHFESLIYTHIGIIIFHHIHYTNFIANSIFDNIIHWR